MIDINDVLDIHNQLIKGFGGKDGIRDNVLLESAIARPYQTFESKELYPDIAEKAAALIESIIKNHPFVDGNKRVGYTLYRLLLLNNNLDVIASQNEKFEFVISIAEGKLNYEGILKWTKDKIHSTN